MMNRIHFAVLKSQTAVNLMTAVGAFAVGIAIRFFMTPYVVRHLGVGAYGFVGLSANILGLMSLLTIAINSMAGRFIAIEYQAGNKKGAKSYYSSLILSNVILAVVIGCVCLGLCWKLECIIRIPDVLLLEVKALFAILSVNTIIVLFSGVWSVGAFICNRIDISNGISLGGNMAQAIVLLALFGLGSAHIWYVGIAALAMELFVSMLNFRVMRHMTPDVSLDLRLFAWSRILTLMKSGSWNLLSKVSELLGQGFDLIVANLFIGVSITGVLAITKNIPFLLLGLFSSIAAAFGPMLVRRYAEGSHSQFMAVLDRSIRVLGLTAAPLLTCLFAFGEDFYRLWMPGQDASLLQFLTILGVLNMVLAMPLEELWTVFTTINKLKWPMLFMFANSLLVFVTIIIGCICFSRLEYKLMVIAGARSAWGIVRSLTFLPLYGAVAVCVSRMTFYVPVFKSILVLSVSLVIALIGKHWLRADSWGMLFFDSAILSLLSFGIGAMVWCWRDVRRYLPIFRGRRTMIHFVHRMDMNNAGDRMSCPLRYFDWPLAVKEHDIDNIDWRWFRASDVVVLGGGGLFDCLENWNQTINEILRKCHKVIAWGVGFNTHRAMRPDTKIAFDKFAALTIRDKDHPSGYEWLPCVSCMAVREIFAPSLGAGTGIVSHRDYWIHTDKDHILNSETPARLINFISRHGTIVTNSYHAAYLAGLLGRKCVLKQVEYSDKFNWLAPIGLDEAKRMNREFYHRVMDLINR